MARYVARRVIFAAFLVFVVSSASFVLTRVAGDPIPDGTRLEREAIRQARTRLGLNRPLGEQYREWVVNAFHLNFGDSLMYQEPIVALVPQRAVNSALLAVAALVVATLVGIPLGVWTGTRHGGVITDAVRIASLILLSMPPLLTSLVLVFAAARTGWLPIGGMRTVTVVENATLDLVRHMVVPVLALALPLAAMFERMQSQAMGETASQPFVMAAFARGVPRARVIWRDALKPGLRSVASVYGVVVGGLLSGSFVVEVVTAWPGIGRLMLDALFARDLYLVAGCAAAGSMCLAVGTLLSDAALALIDPRTRQ